MNELDTLILKILKVEPPLKGNNAQSLTEWFDSIANQNIAHGITNHPILTQRLMWIWLSQVKGITMVNLEK